MGLCRMFVRSRGHLLTGGRRQLLDLGLAGSHEAHTPNDLPLQKAGIEWSLCITPGQDFSEVLSHAVTCLAATTWPPAQPAVWHSRRHVLPKTHHPHSAVEFGFTAQWREEAAGLERVHVGGAQGIALCGDRKHATQ